MKMKQLLLIPAFVLLATLGTNAQEGECDPYYVMTEGAEFTVTSFDKKHKEQGATKSKVSNVKRDGNSMRATIESTQYDDKGKVVQDSMEFDIMCENGDFYMDMSKFIDQEAMSGYEGMEAKVESENLAFPNDPKPGDKLPDGEVKITIKTGAMDMTMTTKVTNRKVEAIEEVTVPAGTYQCVKITYDTQIKMAFVNKTYKATDWYAKNVGMVKSESYKSNGKLIGSTELTEFSK